jgi:arylformamidase
MAAGSSVNVSSVTMSPHVGTHADAPIHVQQGGIGADLLPLEAFYGAVVVVDVSDCTGAIEFDLLSERIKLAGGVNPERILLKTGKTIADGAFPESWPMLSRECAVQLAQNSFRLLGVDCPSVDDRNSKTLDVHHALFDANAYVVENLDLRHVEAGRYRLVAFPTKFVDLDAAPLRAVLLKEIS